MYNSNNCKCCGRRLRKYYYYFFELGIDYLCILCVSKLCYSLAKLDFYSLNIPVQYVTNKITIYE